MRVINNVRIAQVIVRLRRVNSSCDWKESGSSNGIQRIEDDISLRFYRLFKKQNSSSMVCLPILTSFVASFPRKIVFLRQLSELSCRRSSLRQQRSTYFLLLALRSPFSMESYLDFDLPSEEARITGG